jgi:peptidyl-prolyl cis-trans isomerase A (cyclophilin A)
MLFSLLILVFSSCAGTETVDTSEEEAGDVVKEPIDVEKPPTKVEEVDRPEAVPAEPPKAKPERESKVHPGLLDPSQASERAPEVFRTRFDTTKGAFVIEVNRSWAPRGADRFYNLVRVGFFEDIAFFRVLDGFVAQFGISGDPKVSEKWRDANILDEPVKASNLAGYITFAKGGPNTRTTQLFINLADNVNLDRMGFPPFGKVVEGMSVVSSLYSGYGEGAPRGRGPDQSLIQERGNTYLKKQFPKFDYIKTASIVE